jgi:hypothetical protein
LLIPDYFSCGQTQECCKSRKVSFHVHVCILSGRISKRPGWCHFTSRQRNALCSRVANNIKLFRTRARGRGGRKAVENCVSFFPFSQIKPKINMAAASAVLPLERCYALAWCFLLLPMFIIVWLEKHQHMILSRWPLKSGANYVRYINSGVFSAAELVFC